MLACFFLGLVGFFEFLEFLKCLEFSFFLELLETFGPHRTSHQFSLGSHNIVNDPLPYELLYHVFVYWKRILER